MLKSGILIDRNRKSLCACLFLLNSFSTAFNYGPLGHLQTTHRLWEALVKPGDIIIDATCGNGHDSKFLASLALKENTASKLYCIDIQGDAIHNTKQLLLSNPSLSSLVDKQVCFTEGSHEVFPGDIVPGTVTLICYNLGYLPGKKRVNDVVTGAFNAVITKPDTTVRSLHNALPLLKEGGMLSVVAYPGHPGGQEEVEAVQQHLAELDDQTWRVYAHRPLNKPKLPIVFNAFKINKSGSAR